MARTLHIFCLVALGWMASLLGGCALSKSDGSPAAHLTSADPGVDGKGFGGNDPLLVAVTALEGEALRAAMMLRTDGDPDGYLCYNSGITFLQMDYLNQALFTAAGFQRQLDALNQWTITVSPQDAPWAHAAGMLVYEDAVNHVATFNRYVLGPMHSDEVQRAVYQEAWRLAGVPAVGSGVAAFPEGADLSISAGICEAAYWNGEHDPTLYPGGLGAAVFSDEFSASTLGSTWINPLPACGFAISGGRLIPGVLGSECGMQLALPAQRNVSTQFFANANGYPFSIHVAYRIQSTGRRYEIEISEPTQGSTGTVRLLLVNGASVTQLAAANLPTYLYQTQVNSWAHNNQLGITIGQFSMPLLRVSDSTIDVSGGIEIRLQNVTIDSLQVAR